MLYLASQEHASMWCEAIQRLRALFLLQILLVTQACMFVRVSSKERGHFIPQILLVAPACKHVRYLKSVRAFFSSNSPCHTNTHVCEFLNGDQGWVSVSIVQCHRSARSRIWHSLIISFLGIFSIFMQYSAALPSPSSLQPDWVCTFQVASPTENGAVSHGDTIMQGLNSIQCTQS